MSPFEKHPASPNLLEVRERRFMELAEEVVDTQLLTDSAFKPATASWDGIASEELRAAPKPVMTQAYDVASDLAWAATATRVWADQVRTFNDRVAELQRQRDDVPAEVERFVESNSLLGLPVRDLDGVREHKRDELIRELCDKWADAHNEHIEEGSRRVTSMFQHGPTWEHLEFARHTGTLPGGIGLAGFFTAGWESAAAPTEALRLAGLLSDPAHQPTEAELAEFHDLLERFADDEAFWYHFLSGLSPEGLLLLNGNLAIQTPDQPGNNPDWDARSELVGDIQRLLGEGLATATAQRGVETPYGTYQPGDHELPASFLVELTRAGQQQYQLGGPGTTFPNGGVPVYGYQLLAPLLNNGDFDDRFLVIVGGDMIDFEMAQGGSDFWAEDIGVGSNFFHMRLDWTKPGGAAGFDPMGGLMAAMERNPEGALAVLHGVRELGGATWADGTPKVPQAEGDTDYGISPPPRGFRLPRLDYLLTDREWPADLVNTGELYNNPPPENLDNYPYRPALTRFGDMLVEVTRLDDERAVEVMELIVYELATDERAMGYPNGAVPGASATVADVDYNIVPPTLREPLATMLADYIVDVNRSMLPADLAMGPGDRGAQLDKTHLLRLLAEVGKDEQSHEIVTVAQVTYTAQSYLDYLGYPDAAPLNPDGDRRLDALELIAEQSGAVMGAVDAGASHSHWHEAWQREQSSNAQENEYFDIAGHILGAATDSVRLVPGAGYAFSEISSSTLEGLADGKFVDNRAQSHYLMTQVMGHGEEQAVAMMEAALYQSGALPDLPDQLMRQDGTPKPVSEWGPDDQAAWERYKGYGDTPGRPQNTEAAAVIGPATSTAAQSYANGFEAARAVLRLPPRSEP
ncbi:hypothetical protein JQS43_20345 [Natronosporangium hydrolyticum]|uniref:Uncharacterized protein n=1 Tax=Natronosporangium hydrolyticum TaxID=2811111 RepID=A0A895Y836_9ACTN|nr:hypothetical protein [Natronosporangium hydrolyticum]QSB13877.1 hypothetical protein JQS43_20345 [Natronosporangium hydrolyticum]